MGLAGPLDLSKAAGDSEPSDTETNEPHKEKRKDKDELFHKALLFHFCEEYSQKVQHCQQQKL